jgi:predicted amidohydrolase
MINIALVQPDITWEDVPANLAACGELMVNIQAPLDVVFLPELFTTGFTMRSPELAEEMDGKTMQWMKSMAGKMAADIVGSIIIREEGKYYNRLIWMRKDGSYLHYDKRHLFRMSDEEKHYSAGRERIIVDAAGARFLPLVCYDLRFPVWSRSRGDYDVLVYLANWPAAREAVWETLLKARAIENQAYVIGVNRVGTDGMGIDYRGGTRVFNAKGECVFALGSVDSSRTGRVELSLEELKAFRQKFPVWKDADPFKLEI